MLAALVPGTSAPSLGEESSTAAARHAALDAETEALLAELLADGPLPPDIVAELGSLPQRAVVEAQQAKKVWKDGKRPLPFDQFCIKLDGKALFPRQYKAFASTNMLAPEAVINPRNLHQFVLVFGKGSGKDYMVAKFTSWVFYVLLHLDGDPADFFGLAPYSRLSIINVASTAVQAKNVFFGQYLQRFCRNKLFAPFGLAWDEGKRAKTGESSSNADSIVYRRRDADGTPYECIGLYSMHSKAASLEGHNIFCWVMDEADAFLDNADKSNAQDVYNTLRSSSQRFQRNWFGLIISYPRVEGGFMMRLYELACQNMVEFGAAASYYADLAPSWDVNPKFNRNDPDVVEQYKNNYAAANALYGCVPQKAMNGFFEFPEKILQAIDPTRQPVAIVTVEPLNLPLKAGGETYYLTGTVGHIARVPGYAYYMAGDAGAKKDAFALSVFHVDVQPDAYTWLCPRCGDDKLLRAAADYEKQPMGKRIPYDEAMCCGSCLTTPTEYYGGWNGGVVHVQDWWQRLTRDESSVRDGNGRVYNIGHLYEDLIVHVKPQRATNSDKNTEQGRNRLVYFPGMQELCRQLIEGLGIVSSRFDPWQTMEITQGLIASTGGDIGELKQSNPEQYRRATFTKSMLHNNLLTLLPHALRDREWERLQDFGGNRVHHPDGPGESNDIFVAESMCIWTAAVNRCSRLDVDWV